MADKLTPQQHQAVHDRGGRLLVSAAAGSGKTKVLVDRLMSYLTDPIEPADLDDFLIITYTKAAASELRGKIAAKLTERIAQEPENRHLQKQMQRLFLTKISTVHGFCADVLRDYAHHLELPADFRVADENECTEIRDRVLSDLLDRAYQSGMQNEDFRTFVDTQGLGRTDKLVPEIIQKVYDSSKCHMDPEKWLDACLEASTAAAATDASDTVWGRYLMDDLMDYLDCQIQVLSQYIKKAEEYPEYEKQVIKLRATLLQLEAIRRAESWDEVVSHRTVDYGRLVFPKKHPDPDLAERIKAVRNACKENLEKKLRSFSDPSEQVLRDLSQTAAGVRGLVALVRQFDREYSAAKRSRRCLDFSDLEHRTLDLLLGKSRSGPTAAAAEIAQRYREIMVDEYQDSNGVQDAIFSTLTEKRKNCFLVGDVKQSIYQFRLADPGIFLEKYHAYISAENAQPGQGRKVLLSHNFRSGCEVIEAVNDVFTACMRPKVGGLTYGEAESLREGIPHEVLPDPAVELYALDVREESYPEEAEFVAEKIQHMLHSQTLIRKEGGIGPVRPEDIVILLRSPGSTAGYFQRSLEARGIRCTSGSGTNLLQTQEAATIRAFLQTIQNPRQDIPLISTLASPIFGFTADRLAQIRSRQKKGAFFDALLLDDAEDTAFFLEMLNVLRRSAQMDPLSVLLEKCYSLTRLDSIYSAMSGGAAKAVNLQMFYQLAVDFEKGSLRDLSQFLEHLTALENTGIPGASAGASGCVTIMSIHKSKGLEFPVVFLCNLSKRFNQENLRAQILCDKTLGIGLSIADTQQRIRYPSISKRAIAVKMAAESLSEEMRVLYVAMTRARDRLIMTYASRTLDTKLKEITLRQDLDGGELLCRDAGCLGDWVLLCATGKTEAGALHAISDRPGKTQLSRYPWKISVEEAPKSLNAVSGPEIQGEKLPPQMVEQLKEQLSFQYAHRPATVTPSKQTATGRKGRVKDEEAAQNAGEPRKPFRSWRKPGFAADKEDGVTYGNAMHKVMQHIRYDSCTCLSGVNAELERLKTEGFLSPEHAVLVSAEKIAGFFDTEIGKKLRTGTPCIREFKFSILDAGSNYGSGLEEEQVLLQGVVDCAMIEEEGITVLDFKSDRITGEAMAETIERYRPQVEAYGQALSRIFEKPVKKKYLYFFQLNQFVSV